MNEALPSPEEIRQVFHALRVHQIELEMQNEELRRTQAELDAARARYFDLYDLAPVGYCTLGEKGLILEANLTAAGLLSTTKGALVKKSFTGFIVREDQDIYYRLRKQLFETGAPQACELRMTKKDGDPFWALVEATAAKDAGGAPMCRVVMSDITERKQADDELHRAKDALETAHLELQKSLKREQLLARTDDLTGLWNRRYFFELAVREFNAAVRYSRPLTILMFDVDDLKRINDTLGHKIGDEVLAWIAKATAANSREIDIPARYGGDEFVILLPQTSAQSALSIAERLRERVLSGRLETNSLGFTISIGIAEMWGDPGEASIEGVVQRADKALYTAKAKGRNRTMIFSAETSGSEP